MTPATLAAPAAQTTTPTPAPDTTDATQTITTAAQAEAWVERVVGPDFEINALAFDTTGMLRLRACDRGDGIDIVMPFAQLDADQRFSASDVKVHIDATPCWYQTFDAHYTRQVDDHSVVYLVPRLSDALGLYAAGINAAAPWPGRKVDAIAMDELMARGIEQVKVWYENTPAGRSRAERHAELLRGHTYVTHKGEIRPAFTVWQIDWPAGSPADCAPGDVWRLKSYDRQAFRASLDRMKSTAVRQPQLATLQQDHASADLDTDLGNARRLIRSHGENLRYNAAVGKWLVWDGTRWAVDSDGQVTRYAKDVGRLVLAEAGAEKDDARRRRLIAHSRASESRRSIAATVELAQTEPGVTIQPDTLDQDAMVLNVLNGTLDLRTGTLRAHSREDMISKVAGAAYDPSAQCTQWLKFLDRIFQSDVELIGFMQRLVGYTITGRVDEQVMAILHGTGANGKSVFLETVRALMGPYSHVAEASSFLASKGDRVRNDIAAMAGARMVSASESDEGARLSEALVKSVTGKERVRARFLYRESFEFMPQFTLYLAANHRPVVTGGDEGIWRRILLIPFSVTIPEHERDHRLLDRLLGELPGILAWAVQGCLEWQRIGLAAPASVTGATQEYRETSDVLRSFLEDTCEMATGFQVSSTLLYAAWVRWCQGMGEEPGSQKAFSERLPAKGIGVRKSGGTKIRTGVRLREGVMDEAIVTMSKMGKRL
jgi:P4 family phage/plasmid primase-like protien